MLSRVLVSTAGGAISNVGYTDLACRTDKAGAFVTVISPCA